MFSRPRLAFRVAVFCTSLLALAQNTSQKRLITQPIDSSKLVTLTGNTRGEASAENDLGKLDDSFPVDHMLLQLKRSPALEKELQTFIDQQHDSSSPNFHKWLTPDEFGKRYGLVKEDLETIVKWLESNGFKVNTVYPSGMVIDFSGNAGQIATAFHTEMHKLSVNGVNHIANVSDPRIPAALAPAIEGIASLHDFRPKKAFRARKQYTVTLQGNLYQVVTPADLATIYDLSPAFAAGITGQGQTIAVVEDSDLYTATDWSNFRNKFGLSAYSSGTLSTTHPAPASGSNNCTDPGTSNGSDDEATLDAEWASAAAPGAAIQVAVCNDTTTTFGGLIAVQNLISQKTPPQVMSMSFQECEAVNGSAANATYNSAFQQAVSEGVSVFVSAGDAGPAACDDGASAATHGIAVNAFGSTPYNVSVGGTDFGDTYAGTNKTYWGSTNTATYGSALSYIPEIPWNDSCAGGLLAASLGYSTPYGTNGYCGNATADGTLVVSGGGGGPSGCATGTPSQNSVISGTCAGYPKPSWQTGLTGIPNDSVRDTPDVSLFAADGTWGHFYLFCYSNPNNSGLPCTGAPSTWVGGGGTSFSAPILAGIQALVNQKLGSAQGNPNPVYYKLAASSVGSTVFHSLSKGDTAVNCSGTINCFGTGFVARGRSATPTTFGGDGALSTSSSSYAPAFAANGSYSMATGIGSVDAYNLIMNWTKGQ